MARKEHTLNCIKCNKVRRFYCLAEMKRKNKTGMCIECMRKYHRTGRTKEKAHNWRGDAVGYIALHIWVKRNLDKPQTCRDCNLPKRLDLANISQEYKRELSDWEWLCRSCHMKKDGRLERLQEAHKKGGWTGWNKGVPMRPEVKAKMMQTKRERRQIQ